MMITEMKTMTMIDDYYSLYLQHHGVQGQKWGVRRYQNKDGSLTSAGKKRRKSGRATDKIKKTSNNVKKIVNKQKAKRQAARQANSRKTTHRRASKMTDSELDKRISRLQLEKKYKDLRNDTSATYTGRKLVSDILTASVKNIGTQAATFAIGSLLNKSLEKYKDGKFKDGIVNPKKGQKDKK